MIDEVPLGSRVAPEASRRAPFYHFGVAGAIPFPGASPIRVCVGFHPPIARFPPSRLRMHETGLPARDRGQTPASRTRSDPGTDPIDHNEEGLSPTGGRLAEGGRRGEEGGKVGLFRPKRAAGGSAGDGGVLGGEDVDAAAAGFETGDAAEQHAGLSLARLGGGSGKEAFPDDEKAPAGVEHLADVPRVAIRVAAQLGDPPGMAGMRNRRRAAAGMVMPEAAPDLDRDAPGAKDDVRPTGQVRAVQAVTVSRPVQHAPNEELGLRVDAADARHEPAAMFGGKGVHAPEVYHNPPRGDRPRRLDPAA